MPSFPPKLYCYHYISSYIRKIIQTRRGQCTLTFLKIVSQNAPDCISAHIYCKIFPDPPRKRVAFGHSAITLPPPPQTTINPTVDRTLLGGIRQLVNTPGWGDRDCIHVSKGIVHACVNSSQRSLNVSLVEHILRILRARLNGKVRLVCKGWHVRLRVQCKAQFQRSIPSLSDTLT